MTFSLAACGGDDLRRRRPPRRIRPPRIPSHRRYRSAESDLAYVQDKGTLVVGITEFEPMDYQDADGNWIGFDADMAKAFAESLGVDGPSSRSSTGTTR